MGEPRWDMEAEVVVLGSGGAALTAAIAAHDFGAKEVLVLEKSGMIGGTTAMSGGMLWIPNNHHQVEAGVADSDEDVVSYLDSLAPGKLDPETLAAFMESGPEMVRYFADRTPVRLKTYVGFPDYQNRGDNSYDNWCFWGDQTFKPPHCTLGVLEQAPFYAVKMESGALGTSGGPKTNGHAQVVDWNNEPIPGLYAAGNAMAAVLGNACGGAGGTLGPGMTFGFIAGRHAATC